jgi:hypothetical protein
VHQRLAEGKGLLAAAQQYLVDGQCRGITWAHAVCEQCDARLSLKGWHHRQIRTVFGRVTVRSARVRQCACAGARPGASFSPMVRVVPAHTTPELEYLQVRWAAHLPYAVACNLLNEILPISDSISVSGVKRSVRAVGTSLDAKVRSLQDAAEKPGTERPPTLTALAVDSA